MTDVGHTAQASFADSLRAVADWLDAHPELPEPYRAEVMFNAGGDDGARAELGAVARALPRAEKSASDHGIYSVEGALGRVKVHAVALREAVCEKVVTTEEVTELVPDPTADVPMVEVTKTVEKVDWVCTDSLLRPEVAA